MLVPHSAGETFVWRAKLEAPIGGSDHHNGKPARVLCEGRQQLHVVAVARDDLDTVAGGKVVGLGCDNRVDTGWRWVEARANRVLPQRAGRVAEFLVHIGNVREVQQSAHVIVVTDVPGEDALSEDYGWYDQVRGVLPQHAQARPSMFVQGREAFDRAGVENDDQPAALCTLRAGLARAGRRATARG